ncbi:MAG: hypothetical protein R6U96_00360 [Promethearchaeia archaeon]
MVDQESKIKILWAIVIISGISLLIYTFWYLSTHSYFFGGVVDHIASLHQYDPEIIAVYLTPFIIGFLWIWIMLYEKKPDNDDMKKE